MSEITVASIQTCFLVGRGHVVQPISFRFASGSIRMRCERFVPRHNRARLVSITRVYDARVCASCNRTMSVRGRSGSGNQNCVTTTGEEFHEEPEGNPTTATGYEQTPPHDHERTWHANACACNWTRGVRYQLGVKTDIVIL